MVLNERIQKTKKALEHANTIIIGARAGLSAVAGFDYGGKRFIKNFLDFKEKYGIEDMYTGSFYPFESKEEKWAYWARMVQCNTYDTKPTSLYKKLLKLIEDKNYFVIIMNTDNQFMINCFDQNCYFETQGNYKYFQCHKGCHRKVYEDQKLIELMVRQTKDCKIPTALVPKEHQITALAFVQTLRNLSSIIFHNIAGQTLDVTSYQVLFTLSIFVIGIGFILALLFKVPSGKNQKLFN